MTKKHGVIAALALVCALMLLLSGCKSQEQLAQTAQAANPQSVPDVYVTNEAEKTPSVIVVRGSGETTLIPDMATFIVRIKAEDAEAQKAQQANTELSDAVLAALKADGIDDKDISTLSLSLDEKYDYSKDVAEVTGYTMSHEINVIVRNIDSLPQIISDVIAAGATSTYNLQLTVSSSDSAYADALKIAVASAQAKAEALAAALGVKLVPVPVTVNELSSSYSPSTYRDMDLAVPQTDGLTAAATADNGASLSTGELKVNADVEVTYEIINAE